MILHVFKPTNVMEAKPTNRRRISYLGQIFLLKNCVHEVGTSAVARLDVRREIG